MIKVPPTRFASARLAPTLGPCIVSLLSIMAGFVAALGAPVAVIAADSVKSVAIELSLRSQTETSAGSGRYHRTARRESWNPKETAVIVCDMWDSHHCLNAVRRVGELAPRINDLLVNLRERGATIIHAPSDCMKAYVDTEARRRAQSVKPADNVPSDIGRWCDQISPESPIPYPLDQSAGGEDDELVEHAQWAATLQAAGRNPRAPWVKQCETLTIDQARDYISDSGTEIWSILEDKQIKHVALVGVHTNMCVLGRPFGLRQLASHGKQVVLIRDMTDTMYDPRAWPYVSHFSGTDLIIDHIERHVCPTVSSDQILGGSEFRFAGDRRPVLAFLIGEDEYETEKTLPQFAAAHLGNYRLNFIFSSDNNPATMPGIEQLPAADALFVSMRRRPLPPEQLSAIKQFVASGKPVIGIRTASHAFSLRNKAPQAGLADWPEFDKEILGGNYTNHYANDLHPMIRSLKTESASPLAMALQNISFQSTGSLYKVAPLAPGATPLVEGKIDSQPAEPIAWTHVRAGGGRAFYTSLGHKGDFEQNEFRMLLINGINWACDQPLVTLESVGQQRARYESGKGKQRK